MRDTDSYHRPLNIHSMQLPDLKVSTVGPVHVRTYCGIKPHHMTNSPRSLHAAILGQPLKTKLFT